jgi:hypothetical protein
VSGVEGTIELFEGSLQLTKYMSTTKTYKYFIRLSFYNKSKYKKTKNKIQKK